MDVSFYVSCVAVLISLISLGWSIHIGNRDRDKLLVQSEICSRPNMYKKSFPDVSFIKIKAVNYGRRPVILTTLWKCFADKTRYETKLDNRRLEEHEQFVQEIDYDNMRYGDDNGNIKVVTDLYLEDTLKRLYKIKNVRKYLKEIRNKVENKAKTL